jgi:hypothetical protein
MLFDMVVKALLDVSFAAKLFRSNSMKHALERMRELSYRERLCKQIVIVLKTSFEGIIDEAPGEAVGSGAHDPRSATAHILAIRFSTVRLTRHKSSTMSHAPSPCHRLTLAWPAPVAHASAIAAPCLRAAISRLEKSIQDHVHEPEHPESGGK